MLATNSPTINEFIVSPNGFSTKFLFCQLEVLSHFYAQPVTQGQWRHSIVSKSVTRIATARRVHLVSLGVRLGAGRRADAGGSGGVAEEGARRVEEGVEQLLGRHVADEGARVLPAVIAAAAIAGIISAVKTSEGVIQGLGT